jgi:hypothetical protein
VENRAAEVVALYNKYFPNVEDREQALPEGTAHEKMVNLKSVEKIVATTSRFSSRHEPQRTAANLLIYTIEE